ncbi:hypothetical protein OK016_08420 [Vibrio chagasii]|nr:hypothetical protein [Vibrio chagasii]
MLFLISGPAFTICQSCSLSLSILIRKRRRIVLRSSLSYLVILLLFLLAGQSIMNFLHVQPETLSISGGIILFIIATR